MRIILFLALLNNMTLCQLDLNNAKLLNKSNPTKSLDISIQIKNIQNEIQSLISNEDNVSNRISVITNLIDSLQLKDFQIIEVLTALDNISHPLILKYFVHNLFYEIDHSYKLRRWDYNEFPFYTVLSKSKNLNLFKYLLLESDLLNNCNLSDSKIKMIYTLLESGYAKYNYNSLKEISFYYFPLETCRVDNLRRIQLLEEKIKK